MASLNGIKDQQQLASTEFDKFTLFQVVERPQLCLLTQPCELSNFTRHSAGLPTSISFSEWSKQLKENFEQLFWIPTDRDLANQREGPESGYIHRTGIYKDCVGATQRYSDYQLRPNFPIAMVVSPDLFSPQNAWDALGKVEELLLGPLGLRTLDPK